MLNPEEEPRQELYDKECKLCGAKTTISDICDDCSPGCPASEINGRRCTPCVCKPEPLLF